MTSPGGEHVSRYRALGEFDSLIRAARDARQELRKLREEEAKLNAQSMADDKAVAASKQNRAKAEKESAESAKKSVEDLNKGDVAGKAGEDAGVSYSRGTARGIDKGTKSPENKRFLDAATNALKGMFAQAGEEGGTAYSAGVGRAIKRDMGGSGTSSSEKIIEDSVKKLKAALGKAGDESGEQFLLNIRQRFRRDSDGAFLNSGFEYSLRELANRAGDGGKDTGTRYIMGFASKIKNINEILPLLGQDKLNLDVDIEDAKQSISALEIELSRLAHTTAEPRVRIDANRALAELRGIQKVFKDEVADNLIKESIRIRTELEKIDKLPSGKAFKFWALTALADMTRVFGEAEEGVGTFEKLRRAIAASNNGGGGNYFRGLIASFDNISEAGSNLLQKLTRVSGELYRMPGIIAVLVSAIPALVAGLGALGGGALGLVSALGSVAGYAVAVPGIFAALGTATFALKDTFGGLKDTLAAARSAQQQEAEAKEKARLGTEKALTPAQKYAVLMSQLGENTQKATEGWLKYTEAYAKVQQGIQEKFFTEIVDSVKDLNKFLPIAENLFGKSATAVGKLANEGIKMLTSGPWQKDFGTIATENAKNITNLGKAGFSLIDVFRNIIVAAAPFTEDVTNSLKEGAQAFADWSARARADGTILDFLDETREAGSSLWQILKNLGNVINSFFQSTVDEGQSYLHTLEDITEHWADVAKAQESANSPLKKYMQDIRPLLSSLGDLIADVARGFGGLASSQSNISEMISLLDTLRTAVLPPILQIIQELNDSGIAVTVTQAIGDMLQAIANFLESGAGNALSVFVTVLAGFFELIFNFVSLPGVSDVFGAVAQGLAAVAAVAIVARFAGLFKLWDFFTWMVRNKGNLSGAFAGAARGVAGLPTTAQSTLPVVVPSTIANVDQSRAINNTGNAAQQAATRVTGFSRAMGGMSSAGNFAKGALTGLTTFLGGPWGLAIAGAVIGIGLLTRGLIDQKRDTEDTKNAFIALKNAYADLSAGNNDSVNDLAATDKKFRDIATQAKNLGVSLTDVSGALNNNGQSLDQVNTVLDQQIANYEQLRIAAVDAGGPTNALPYVELKEKAIAFKDSINEVANAQRKSNEVTQDSIGISRTYSDRLGNLSQEQVNAASAANSYDERIKTLSSALDTMASASSNAKERSRALRDIIEEQTGTTLRVNEATETWNGSLLDFKDTLLANEEGLKNHKNAFDINTRAGLRNRDALEQAAKAVRDLYLEDIASGVPMDEATRKHKERITQLEKEATKGQKNKDAVKDLIKTYGDVPKGINTDLQTSGFSEVYLELLRLQTIQQALKDGKSLSQAEREYNDKRNNLYERPPTVKSKGGDGYGVPGYATGGPVWGAGTRTSDSIRAWLSNGEFVQPTDAVEHYGLPVMEALRSRKLDKATIEEALPDGNRTEFSSGGEAHSNNCVSCASGGHKFAQGGLNAPYPVSVKDTLINKDWAYKYANMLGGGSGTGGVAWMMAALRKQFPGLPLISGFRRGSTTLSGNQSYHALNRAVDLPPRRDVAQWIRSNYGANTKELITPYNELNLHNGKPHRYTGAIWNQHNFAGGNAHDHWAFKSGGLVDLMQMLNLNNMGSMPQQSSPSIPRTLSPAASSVVNNSTENTRTFGDVIINNPAPERAGDSIRDALYRTQLIYG